MNRTAIRLAGPPAGILLAVVLGAAPVLAAPAPATGSSPAGSEAGELNARLHCVREWRAARVEPTADELKAVGRCEIDRRLVTIARLGAAVDGARALTDAHESALEAILDRSAAGLRSLRAEIEADTTIPELREDLRRIVTDFRIYTLVTRQVGLVIAADAVDAAGAGLKDRAADLADLIARAEAAGKDVTAAKRHLAAMETAIAEALGDVDGLAAMVLPLTPAEWNAGTAQPVLRAAHVAVDAARADLRTAKAEARQVLAALG